MQIKMNEYLQGSNISAVLVRTGTTVNVLTPGEIYECEDSLSEYILSNHKGVEQKGKVKVEQEEKVVFNTLSTTEETLEDKPIMTSKQRGKK